MNKVSIVFLSGLIAVSGALGAAEVDKRQENQKDRIQEGVKSGELTHKEAQGLRSDEKKINEEKKEDRKENGGKLTKEERKDINKEQNKESKKIYKKKHNDVRRKHAK